MVGGYLGKYVVDFQPSTLLTAEARVQFQTSQCGICGVQSGTGLSFSPGCFGFPCHYHSTNVLYSFVCHHSCVVSAPDSVVQQQVSECPNIIPI